MNFVNLRRLSFALVAITVLVSLSVHKTFAGTLYTNGAINGTSGALSINNFDTVRDTFVITGPSTVTGVDFGAWTSPGNTLDTVSWEILDPTVTTVYASGTANLSGTTLFTNSFNFDVDSESFSINPLDLGSGTYLLGLSGITSVTGGATYWDENGGASTAFTAASPLGTGNGTSSSESFQIIGTQNNLASAPEPSSLAALVVGGSVMGLLVARRRKSLSSKPTLRSASL
jgi:hypothetical protein